MRAQTRSTKTKVLDISGPDKVLVEAVSTNEKANLNVSGKRRF